jgi:Protein of unknown function (DUF3147)
MKIRIDTAARHDTKWYEYAVRVLFGGAVTVFAGIIAEKCGPSVGGLFLAFPAIFPAGATLMEKHQKEKKLRAGVNPGTRGRDSAALDAAGGAMGSVGLLAFAIVVRAFLPEHSSWFVLSASTFAWLVVSVAIWRVCEYL